MLNQNKTTFIRFHVLVSKDIFNEQKEVIDKICQEHSNCKINYYIMDNEFKEFKINGVIRRTTAIYYRLLLQKILPNENKTLYFDCDTLIYKDLTEIYNFNITDKYYVGQYEGRPLRIYGNNLTDFINSGAILINLENLRKDNILDKIIDFLKKNNDKLQYLDQDAINVVCNKKNGIFPSNYISTGICNVKSYIENQRKTNKTKELDVNPYIFHFRIYDKPWYGIANIWGLICFDQFTRFYEYARKSSYYFEILEKFPVRKC